MSDFSVRIVCNKLVWFLIFGYLKKMPKLDPLVIYLNAISYYLPEKSLDNETIIKDFFHYGGSSEVEITSESLYAKCGIKNRFIADLEETSKDLGNRAAEKLFEEWAIAKSTIDYLIFVRDASDYKGP